MFKQYLFTDNKQGYGLSILNKSEGLTKELLGRLENYSKYETPSSVNADYERVFSDAYRYNCSFTASPMLMNIAYIGKEVTTGRNGNFAVHTLISDAHLNGYAVDYFAKKDLFRRNFRMEEVDGSMANVAPLPIISDIMPPSMPLSEVVKIINKDVEFFANALQSVLLAKRSGETVRFVNYRNHLDILRMLTYVFPVKLANQITFNTRVYSYEVPFQTSVLVEQNGVVSTKTCVYGSVENIEFCDDSWSALGRREGHIFVSGKEYDCFERFIGFISWLKKDGEVTVEKIKKLRAIITQKGFSKLLDVVTLTEDELEEFLLPSPYSVFQKNVEEATAAPITPKMAETPNVVETDNHAANLQNDNAPKVMDAPKAVPTPQTVKTVEVTTTKSANVEVESPFEDELRVSEDEEREFAPTVNASQGDKEKRKSETPTRPVAKKRRVKISILGILVSTILVAGVIGGGIAIASSLDGGEWKPKDNSIELVLEDGQTIKFRENETVQISIPEKVGYTFGGYVDENQISVINANGELDGEYDFTAVQSLRLYAKWMANENTIIVQGDGYASQFTCLTDAQFDIPEDVIEQISERAAKHMAFYGFSLTADGAQIVYEKTQTGYAWKAGYEALSFDVYGATLHNAQLSLYPVYKPTTITFRFLDKTSGADLGIYEKEYKQGGIIPLSEFRQNNTLYTDYCLYVDGENGSELVYNSRENKWSDIANSTYDGALYDSGERIFYVSRMVKISWMNTVNDETYLEYGADIMAAAKQRMEALLGADTFHEVNRLYYSLGGKDRFLAADNDTVWQAATTVSTITIHPGYRVQFRFKEFDVAQGEYVVRQDSSAECVMRYVRNGAPIFEGDFSLLAQANAIYYEGIKIGSPEQIWIKETQNVHYGQIGACYFYNSITEEYIIKNDGFASINTSLGLNLFSGMENTETGVMDLLSVYKAEKVTVQFEHGITMQETFGRRLMGWKNVSVPTTKQAWGYGCVGWESGSRQWELKKENDALNPTYSETAVKVTLIENGKVLLSAMVKSYRFHVNATFTSSFETQKMPTLTCGAGDLVNLNSSWTVDAKTVKTYYENAYAKYPERYNAPSWNALSWRIQDSSEGKTLFNSFSITEEIFGDSVILEDVDKPVEIFLNASVENRKYKISFDTTILEASGLNESDTEVLDDKTLEVREEKTFSYGDNTMLTIEAGEDVNDSWYTYLFSGWKIKNSIKWLRTDEDSDCTWRFKLNDSSVISELYKNGTLDANGVCCITLQAVYVKRMDL